MKLADPCFSGLVAMVFGFVMIVIGAIDYLTGNNRVHFAVPIAGIALVLIGMGLSRKKCAVK